MNDGSKDNNQLKDIYNQTRTAYPFISNYPDIKSIFSFLVFPLRDTSFSQKLAIIQKFYRITKGVECLHRQHEMITFIKEILAIPEERKGVIVEAGCFQGGSTAKFSIAAKIAGRNLFIFDSFKGIPPNKEYFFEVVPYFPQGSFKSSLREVKRNIKNFGEIKVCRFIKGWFKDTMPKFSKPIAAIYLDVDLASSTKTCLKYLYPLLSKGGVLISQDGHLPQVAKVFDNDNFWKKEVGYDKPPIEGLWQRKLIKIVKPID